MDERGGEEQDLFYRELAFHEEGEPGRPLGSIMPRGAYRFVYLRTTLRTDGADNIDVAIIL